MKSQARDSRDRRERADAFERRRGLAEANRLRDDQIISAAYAKGGTTNVPEVDYLNASLMTSWSVSGASADCTPVDLGKVLAGKIGGCVDLDVDVHARRVRRQHAEGSRDGAAVDVPFVHRGESRSRRVRADQAAAASQAGEPGAESGAVFGERVRLVNTVNNYTSRPIKVEDIDEARPVEDEGVLQGAVQPTPPTSPSSSSAISTSTRSRRCWRPTSDRCRRKGSPRPPIAPRGCSSRPTSSGRR